MQTPSAKVTTATLVALVAALVTVIAADTSVLEPLPDWLEAIAVALVVGVAGYMKRETNPAR
jgi:ABC-type nickel/cobalt efflux system permease component RcnA